MSGNRKERAGHGGATSGPSKRTIVEFEDSNMGSHWTVRFDLERGRTGAYTLRCVVEDGDPEEEGFEPDPVRRIRTGAGLYRALEGLAAEAGYELPNWNIDLDAVAGEVAAFAPELVQEFQRGAEILDEDADGSGGRSDSGQGG